MKLKEYIQQEIKRQLNEAFFIDKSKIHPQFKIPENYEAILRSVLEYGFKGRLNKSKCYDPEFFNSGIIGISFRFVLSKERLSNQYYLILSPGKVGMEDQSNAAIYLQVKGNTRNLFIVKGESQKFGQLGLNDQLVKNAKIKFNEYVESVLNPKKTNIKESSVSSVGSVITPKGVSQLSTKNILKNIKTNAKYKPVSFGLDSATIEHLISGKRINITNKDLKNYEVVQ